MIPFRTVEDESRYVALTTEIYLRLAATLGRHDPVAVSEILRNLAKLEAMAYSEGIRQGVAAEAIRAASPAVPGTAMEIHRAIYADADTPLCRVEESGIAHPALEPAPMTFQPLTLEEARAQYPAVGRYRERPAVNADAPAERPVPNEQVLFRTVLDRYLSMTSEDEPAGAEAIAELDLGAPCPGCAEAASQDDERHLFSDRCVWRRTDEGTVQVDPASVLFGAPSFVAGEIEAEGSPALVERIRTVLEHLLQTGWRPKGWEDTVLMIHQTSQMAADVIDAELATAQGRALLGQLGLHHVQPRSAAETGYELVEPPPAGYARNDPTRG